MKSYTRRGVWIPPPTQTGERQGLSVPSYNRQPLYYLQSPAKVDIKISECTHLSWSTVDMKEMTQTCCLKPSLPPEKAPSSKGGGFNEFFYLKSEKPRKVTVLTSPPTMVPYRSFLFFVFCFSLDTSGAPWALRKKKRNVPLQRQIFKLVKIKKKKKAASWLWVDDVQNSAKPCGFQSEWSVLPADHYAGLRLLTLPGYPTCGSVVVYEAQRSFHTTQITNLTVPLSTAHLNWFLPIMWLQWCQFFFFFFFTFWAMPFLPSTCPPPGGARK